MQTRTVGHLVARKQGVLHDHAVGAAVEQAAAEVCTVVHEAAVVERDCGDDVAKGGANVFFVVTQRTTVSICSPDTNLEVFITT